MDGLSDIFGGKVHAFDAPIKVHEGASEIDKKLDIDMPKLNIDKHINIFDKKLKGLDDNIMGKKLKGFDDKITGMNKKVKDFNMNTFDKVISGVKNKTNMFQGLPKMNMPQMNMPQMSMPKMMNMKGHNQLMKKMSPDNYLKKMGFGSTKFMNTLNQVQNKAIGNIIYGPEKIARKRIQQQKNLMPFGDIDGDKLMNAFDCDPWDKRKQAEWHKRMGQKIIEPSGQARDLTTGRYISPTEVEDMEMTEEVETPEVEVIPPKTLGTIEPQNNNEQMKYLPAVVEQPTTQPKTIDITPQEEKLSTLEKLKEKLKTGAQKVWEGSGAKDILEERKERKEFEKEIRKASQEQLLKDIKEGKVKTSPYEMAQEASQRKGRLMTVKESWSDMGAGIRAGLAPIGASPDKFSNLLGALPGERGMMMGAMTSTGKGLQMGYLPTAEPPGPPLVGPPTPPMSATPVSRPSAPMAGAPAQFAPEKTVISPYSKRPVSYTRGPYRKRTKEVQVQEY